MNVHLYGIATCVLMALLGTVAALQMISGVKTVHPRCHRSSVIAVESFCGTYVWWTNPDGSRVRIGSVLQLELPHAHLQQLAP